MTQEEKQLLVKALCGYLPYGVKVKVETTDGNGNEIKDEGVLNSVFIDEYGMVYICIDGCEYELDDVKPYLRTMTSMTEEERKEYKDMNVLDNCDEFSNIKKNIEDIKKNGEENYIQLPRTHAQDYLNSIHVDYRGLIEKGLALEAPEGMYN